MKVLVADDDPLILRLLDQVLAEAGYEPTVVPDGNAAWEALSSSAFSLALLDWDMPRMSGIDVCRRLGELHSSRMVYVIILTGHSSEPHLLTALDAGASDFISKPVRFPELLARLRVGGRTVKLHEQLLVTQKLESIGQLAAGIAHEINTPTQYVTDNMRFLSDAFGGLDQVLDAYGRLFQQAQQGAVQPEMVAEIEAVAPRADMEYLSTEIPRAIEQSLDGLKRVADIVGAMKAFTHPSTSAMSDIDLNKTIENTLVVARNEWRYVADVHTDLDPSLPLVHCVAGDISQVVVNIVVNAVHAIESALTHRDVEKGVITVATRRVGDWAEISVRDDGCGIPEAARGKVFDPFFTTKEVGKGTGQGLSIAHYMITERHGGSLSFETEVGGGTTFIIRLPLQAKNQPKEIVDEVACLVH